MDEVLSCATAVGEMMRERGIDRHSIEVLRDGLQAEMKGMEVRYEQVQEGFNRRVDSVTTAVIEGVATRIHTETKTGYGSVGEALGGKSIEQIFKDAEISLGNWFDRLTGSTTDKIQSVWRIVDHTFGAGIPESIQQRMGEVFTALKTKGLPEDAIRSVLESFQFVDKAKQAIKVELSEKGELMFRDAMSNLFDANGKLAQAAEKATATSPDFGPALNTLFGADGKLAGAARGAAAATNLEPALDGFEKKVESGVNTALDKAGTNAQAHAAGALAAKVKEGVGALGGALSAVGGLGTSVIALGEAWNKPNKGATEYFGLMTQLGGTISQGLSAVDAIGKLGTAMQNLGIITKIGAAAQAVFNAVMALNPVVLVVIAVVALIAAIVLLIMYWDQVKAALRDNPWLSVIIAMTGVIGIIILIIAYWDEIKLAVLQAANFISIQAQKIAGFFIGMKNVIGMVWDWIGASIYNLGATIINGLIEFGAGIVNFFIDLLNQFIEIYNGIAKYVPGLDAIGKVERVNVEAIKVAKKAVPEIDVGKAFAQQCEIKGGLEDQIAKQEEVVRKAQEEDKARQEKAAKDKAEKAQADKAAASAPAAPGLGVPTALPGLGAPAALPEGGALPTGGALPAAAGGPDQSIHVEGGIHVTITADRLEADSAQMLTDEMVRQLQERLDALRSERDRRLGVRGPIAA